MIGRRTLLKTVGALTVVGAVGMPRRALAAEVIKVGTLYPKASPWGQVLAVWEKSVIEKSGGRMALQLFYNGVEGDEVAMADKVKSGVLDGAAVSSVGLARLHRPTLALQMPGLFTTWAKLDAARNATSAEFAAGLLGAGAALVGWYDVGMVSMFSRAVPLRIPADFKARKPWQWRDDPIVKALYQSISGITAVPLNVPEVLARLDAEVNALLQSPLMAEQLLWSGKLDRVTDLVVGPSVGGIVVSKARLDALPADLKAILLDTGKITTSALRSRIRNDDAAALARLKGTMTVVTPTVDERSKWDLRFQKTRELLAQGTFTPALVQRLESMA